MQTLILVGSVVDIDGPRLELTRKLPSGVVVGWFQVVPGMKTYLYDVFRTSPDTQAVLEFLVGGRAGIGRKSVVQIVTPKEVSEIYDPTKPRNLQVLHYSAQQIWNLPKRFDKHDKMFRIQTTGGILGGIEG